MFLEGFSMVSQVFSIGFSRLSTGLLEICEGFPMHFLRVSGGFLNHFLRILQEFLERFQRVSCEFLVDFLMAS